MKVLVDTPPPKSALAAIACTAALLLAAGCDSTQTNAQPGAPAAVSVGTTIDDTVVTSKVKSALLADPDVKSFDLKVETRGGEVMLSGFVGNQAQADRAIQVARGVEGVKVVSNKMDLKEGAATVGNDVDDGIITAKVKSALLADPNIKSFDIAVVTRKGEAQLSGFVDTQVQIDHATELARAVEGVKSVANGMSVKK
jgi:hyperosmotically inducible periplasmic protein